MDILLPTLVAVHVLSGVFWAGTTFVLARTSAAPAEALARPQLGAAVLAVLAGMALWHFTHEGAFGPTERVLAIGAVSALVALGLQISAIPAVRRLKTAQDAELNATRSRLTVIQRLAAVCLGVTVICMAASRYIN